MAGITSALLFASLSHVALCMNGWVATEEAVEPSHLVTIRFALRAASVGALDSALTSISDPQSPRFRQYLNHAEVAKLVAPARDAPRAVMDWLSAELDAVGVLSQHGEYITCEASVYNLQKAFAGKVEGSAMYYHTESRHARARMLAAGPDVTASRLVPPAILQHVWAVFDLVELLPVPPRRLFSSGGAPGDMIDPDVIHKQYGLTDGESVGGRTATSQGVAAFEQAQFLPSDVAAFEAHYMLPNITFKVLGPNDGGYFGEAGLDTQYIVTSGRGVPSWFIAQDAFDMIAWCEKVLNMTKPPSVLSISWGSGESNYQAEHMRAASACFQKMGVQGISVFAASGDEGTGKQGFWTCNKFDPTWPASCPYVTAVGGTFLQSGSEQGWAGSGGGFSAVFSAPSFQQAAVKAYSSSATLPDGKLWAAGGRALPDVSALATNYQVFSGGVSAGTLTGTSAATPTFAGMVSVVNDLFVSQHKPTVGFINPALYASGAGAMGFDVTLGNNKHAGCSAGFPAAVGWDAVTGLGTPTWTKLKSALGAKSSNNIVV